MNEINNSIKINNEVDCGQVIDYLEGVIGDEMILNSYIRDIKIIKRDNTSVLFKVESVAAREIIETNYLNVFKQALESIFNSPLEPKFVLNEEEKVLVQQKKKAGTNISKKYTFDTYVTASFNEEVIDMAENIIKMPGKYSPLYIASKSGYGKTHLLHAVGNEFSKAGVSSIYIEPNKFTKDVQLASRDGGTAMLDLIASYKEHDVLLFDDIQNLGDKSVTLRVLLELLNHHIENDKQVVIVSDKVAQELSGFESRFITRFVSGISSKIGDPSQEDIEKILKFKLGSENLEPEKWEKDALAFVARNNTSSIRALEGAVKRISYFLRKETNSSYTQTVIKHIFKELDVDLSELTPKRIINVVAKYYNTTSVELIGKSRRRELIMARHMSMYMVREITKKPFKEIGNIFGGRDHSTIMSAYSSINTKLKVDKAVQMAIKSIETKIKKAS